MLFGTNFLFRVAYFFTSFSPALFLLSLNYRCEKNLGFCNNIISYVLNIVVYRLFTILVVMIACASASYIRKYLIRQQSDKRREISNLALNFNIYPKKFKAKKGYVIEAQEGIKVNSGFISFALSVVVPLAVLIFSDYASGLFSLLIIFTFFLLLMMSNDVFPNIILPMFGVNLMVTKDRYNIFYTSKQNDFLSGIKKLHSLGNAGSLARAYVLSHENFDDDEMEDK